VNPVKEEFELSKQELYFGLFQRVDFQILYILPEPCLNLYMHVKHGDAAYTACDGECDG